MSYMVIKTSNRLLVIASAGLASGWTNFTESVDTRKVYVSSSTGNDSNDGLTENTPKLTIAGGYALIRDTYPDWLLFKRGDTWTNETFDWKKRGRSASEKILISSYGTSNTRPQFNTGTSNFFTVTGGGGAPATMNYVALVGLSAFPHTRLDNATIYGVRWIRDGGDFLIEDCKFDSYTYNIDIEADTLAYGSITNVSIRRNTIVDAYTTGSAHGQGLFCTRINYLLVEENLFDHNGWKAIVGETPDIFKHNIYIDTSNGQGSEAPIIRRNFLTNASSHGLQARSGGFVYENVVVRNSIGILLGGGTVSANTHVNGVQGSVYSNVVLEGKDITGDTQRGQGIELANIGLTGASCYNNIIANKLTTNTQAGLSINASDASAGVGVNNSTFYNNIIYNWGYGLSVPTVTTPNAPTTFVSLSGNSFSNNDLQDPSAGSAYTLASIFPVNVGQITYNGTRANTTLSAFGWFKINNVDKSLAQWNSTIGDTATSTAVSYADPNRSLATYNVLLGGTASTEAFLNQVRNQSRYNWNSALTPQTVLAYLQAGFVN